jgi:hypothetical protein
VVSEEGPEDADEPMPTRTKIVAGLVGCALLLGAMYAMIRLSSPAIRPGQAPPAGHYTLECGFCHPVSPDAPVTEGSGE